MKKSKSETAETRRRIVETAARELHRKGIDATGVSEVMSAAGLTRGGFYRHFDSKEHLVAEACTAGLEAIVARAEAAASGNSGADGLDAIAENYLALDHRNDQSGGCPLAGLGSELARANDETRAAATAGLLRLIALIAKQTGRRKPEAAHSDALFALSAMVGAVTLSRIATDPDLSAAILTETRKHLGNSSARGSHRRGPSRARGSTASDSLEGVQTLLPA